METPNKKFQHLKLHKQQKQQHNSSENSTYQKRLKQFLTSNIYMLFMSILTVYSIFAIDIDKGFFNKDASIFFSTVHLISMFIFTVQIILAVIVEKGYLFNFYFWIDVFSTVMMLLELIWIQDIISSLTNVQVAVSFTRVSKASRFSKIGARSTKILKLIRLIKLMKLYKPKQQQKTAQNQQIGQQNNNEQIQAQKQKCSINNQIVDKQNTAMELKLKRPNVDPQKQKQIQLKWQIQSQQMKKKEQPQNQQQLDKGTKVGEILKYQIQKNIVIMVMGIIMVVPILSADTWFNKTADMQPSTSNYLQIVQYQSNDTIISYWLQSFLQISLSSSRPVAYFQFNDYNFPNSYNQMYDLSNIHLLSQLRQAQKISIHTDTFQIIYSKKEQTSITSWLNMIQSFVIMFLLLFTSIAFVKDLEMYALSPLEKMNATVLKIQSNPFSVMQNDQNQQEQQSQEQEKKQKQQLQLETNILQKFFIKISRLLALGVGQTPFNTSFTSNQLVDKNQSIFQQASPVQVEGVFMCFQVAHIEQIIINLNNKASCYMNQMLKLFHQTVIENGGFIFHQDLQYSIVCWKIPARSQAILSKNMHIKEQKKITQLAFITYIKFIQRVTQNEEIKKYDFLNQNIPKRQHTRFHIGIHFGKAYCGIVGSQFKLSLRATGQDISITKSLCRAAKKYQLQNIISSSFTKLIPFAHSILRKTQQFRFQQNQKIKPIQTFSFCITNYFKFDSNIWTSLSIKDSNKIPKFKQYISQKRGVKRIFQLRQQILKNNFKYKTQQINNICKSYLKKNSNLQEFIDLWKQSNTYYEDGQWANAKSGFQSLKDCSFLTNDILLQLRLSEIGNLDQPPVNWKRQKLFSLFL